MRSFSFRRTIGKVFGDSAAKKDIKREVAEERLSLMDTSASKVENEFKGLSIAVDATASDAQDTNRNAQATCSDSSETLTLYCCERKLDTCRLSDFRTGAILGTGSFGRVSLAWHIETGMLCAIKALSKAHIVKNQQVSHLRAERDVLNTISHPFLVKLLGGFQDTLCVYFIMEFVCGGEFFRHLKNHGKLSEDMARFYATEVLVAFEYLHGCNIIYRDLKPENILLDNHGHIKITDFGFAKTLPNDKRTYTLCGTPDYLAPEIILNKGHGKPADWWSFGVLVYEMVAGYPPFYDEDIATTYRKILSGHCIFPPHFSVSCRDLVRKLLQVDISKRYGCLTNGTQDIRSHPWFRGVHWQDVASCKQEPPIRPILSGADDTSNFDDYSSISPMKHEFELSKYEQSMFIGF